MSGVTAKLVKAEDAGQRLDRWFRRHYPGLAHGRLEKLLRTGQIRVDGGRAKANLRLEEGQTIRIPPMGEEGARARDDSARAAPFRAEDAAFVKGLVLHKDQSVLVLNKPPGLAVQGGTKTERHLDALLDHLRFDKPERPRLVHRLDRDTSGVLVLARTRLAATALTAAFRGKTAKKLYWALVAGVPRPRDGAVTAPLVKLRRGGEERVVAGEEAEAHENAQTAITHYAVIAQAGRKAAWLALMPETGRTHQLRAHCAYLKTPVVGDGKYGGEAAFPGGLAPQLHLHARRIAVPHPGGGTLRAEAPLPEHMQQSWQFLGFDTASAENPFEEEME